jgi:superfamily II DNA/RNA helicase
MEKGVCRMEGCKMLVLDEADKLLSTDFTRMLDKLIGFLPSKRQILLFSATFPLTVEAFMRRHGIDPYKINLMDELTLKVRPSRHLHLRELCILMECVCTGSDAVLRLRAGATKGPLPQHIIL